MKIPTAQDVMIEVLVLQLSGQNPIESIETISDPGAAITVRRINPTAQWRHDMAVAFRRGRIISRYIRKKRSLRRRIRAQWLTFRRACTV